MTSGRLRATQGSAEAGAIAGLSDGFGARVHIDVTIPRTGIKGRMRLADRAESLSIVAEARRLFKAMNLLDDEGRIVGVAGDEWNAEIAVRYLAVAVRDPADESKPLDSLDEWRQCDDDQIEKLWSDYKDLREQIDPLGDGNAALTASDLASMEAAVKKKESAVLMSFGSRKLATYLLTTAAQPAL